MKTAKKVIILGDGTANGTDGGMTASSLKKAMEE
jgi:hypothetical protein